MAVAGAKVAPAGRPAGGRSVGPAEAPLRKTGAPQVGGGARGAGGVSGEGGKGEGGGGGGGQLDGAGEALLAQDGDLQRGGAALEDGELVGGERQREGGGGGRRGVGWWRGAIGRPGDGSGGAGAGCQQNEGDERAGGGGF